MSTEQREHSRELNDIVVRSIAMDRFFRAYEKAIEVSDGDERQGARILLAALELVEARKQN